MKTSGWNKLPLWARYFGIAIGVPALIAIVRVVLEHRFSKFTGDVLLIIILIPATILVCWPRKKQSRPTHEAPQTKEDRQHENREGHKLSFIMFVLFTLVLLTGTFFGFCIMFSALPEGYTEILYGVFRVFGAGIGLVGLLFAFVCFEQAKFEFLLLRGYKPARSANFSYQAVLGTLAIVLAIAFAITKLGHL